MQKFRGGIVNRKTGWKEALIKFLLYGGEFWFLYVLFEICLVAPIIHFMCLKMKRAILFEIILCIASLFVKTNVFCINLVIYYMIYYTLGQILHLYFDEESKNITNNKWVILVAAFIFCILLLMQGFGIDFIMRNIIVALLGSLVLYWVAGRMKPQHIVTKYFEYAGVNSMGIYIVQGYCLVVTRTILIILLKMNNPYIIYILLVICICMEAMFACMLMARIRPMAFIAGIPYKTKKT